MELAFLLFGRNCIKLAELEKILTQRRLTFRVRKYHRKERGVILWQEKRWVSRASNLRNRH